MELCQNAFFCRARRPYGEAADLPWDMADAETKRRPALFRYLRGGGSRAFGMTTCRMRADRRQTRFLAFCAFFAVVWCVFFFT